MNSNFNFDNLGEIMYITNITGEIKLPWEPGLLEWLQEHYPASKYRVVELT